MVIRQRRADAIVVYPNSVAIPLEESPETSWLRCLCETTPLNRDFLACTNHGSEIFIFPTIFPDPASRANDTNLSFSHENNEFAPFVTLSEVAKLVMEVQVSAI